MDEMGFDLQNGWVPTGPNPATGFYPGEGAIGGGGRVYATSYQQDAYNIWEHNEMRVSQRPSASMRLTRATSSSLERSAPPRAHLLNCSAQSRT